MGAKTHDDPIPGDNGGPASTAVSSAGGEPRGAHLSRDGDGSMGDGGGDDDDGDDDEDEAAAVKSAADDGNKKKKKRKPRKKKKQQQEQHAGKAATEQSCPPRVPLSDLFPSGEYPAGETLAYLQDFDNNNTARTTGEELRYLDRKHLEDPALLNDYRRAAEVHRQVRRWAQDRVRPGQTLAEIAVGIEDGVRALLGNQGLAPGDALRAGMGFPTGLSVNSCVAHYTPNPGQRDVVLQRQDVMKVDFGVHVNGWIVDSAFTMSFDPVYDNLLAAVRDATDTGIRTAGIDVRICDVSAAIQETMESYEVEINGRTYPVKPVRNICAHDIKRYRIHGSKAIPFVRNADRTRMEEGEIFAIETFGSTGRGRTTDDVGTYGYCLRDGAQPSAGVSLPFASANRLYRLIREQFGTLVFCRRYLERLGAERYLAGLKCLVDHGVLDVYPPMVDVKGSYSAQFEHTILLMEAGKEVVSRGSDY